MKAHLKLLKTLTGHVGAIYDVIFFDNHLYTSSADKFTVQWDINVGKQTGFAIKTERSSYSLAISPDYNKMAIGTNDGGIHVIDMALRKEIRLLKQHKDSIFSLTYNPVTKHFYSGDREGYLCVWEGETFDLLITLPYNCGKIREIAVSPDGKWLALCGQDGIVRILETDFFNEENSFNAHEEGVNCALFKGEFLYTGGKDAHIRKWNWREQKMLIEVPAHNYAVYDLEFFKNDEYLVSVSFDKSLKLFKSNAIEFQQRIEGKDGGHRHTVNRIAKICDDTFATVGDDRTIKIWQIVEE